jgi:hypothetical protein
MRRASLALLLAVCACSRGSDDEGKRRVFSRGEEAAPGQPHPPAPALAARPAAALALRADEVARGLGSFEWSAAVEWSVSRQGDDAQRVRAVERHRVRQLASGEFEVSAELDPGLGPGSESGREVVFTGGMTYARAKHAAYRERPTDRGRDAARFRDESFGVGAAIARLYGDALALAPAGDVTVLGRPAKRFKLSLAKGAAPAAAAASPASPASGAEPDADTARRRRFLDGRVPSAADGELVLDAATGAPLRLRLAGAFTVRDDPSVRTSVELLAQVKALGKDVAAVAAPKGALPDERKPAGVTGALDAAGLRKRADDRKGGRGEPADEPAE